MWWVGERLLTGSVQGAAVVALVWLVCRNIGAIPASARACLWWLASLKLALALVPLPSLEVPLLPSYGPAEAGHYVLGPAKAGRDVETTIASHPVDASRFSRLSGALLPDPAALSPASADEGVRSTEPARTSRVWLAVAIGLWLAGVAVLTLHLLRVYTRLRSVVRRSTPIGAEAAEIVDRLARLLALKKTPDVRVSDHVTTPLVAGLLRPTVLIPARALDTLSPGERAMAICHEFAHVRRHDLLLGWVPALAERLFFFHPLARLAAHEYVVAREAACDALVLRAMDVAPQAYGRMLVRLGVGGLDPAFMAAGSSPSLWSLRRRLDMLHHLTFTGSRRRVIWLFVAVSALTFLPLRLVARAPLQPQAPAAATSVPVSVVAEQAAAAAPARERTHTTPAAPSVPTEAFLTQATEDALRQAEAEYRKAVEVESGTTAEQERTIDFLKKEYEAKVREYEAALINFTGNQQPTEAEQIDQKARARAQQEFDIERLRRMLEQAQQAIQAEVQAREVQQAGQSQENAQALEKLRRELVEGLTQQAELDSSQARVQLETLARAQQTLVEQLKNLVAQQERLSMMQRQLSDQVEAIRRELERASRAIARPPAAAPPGSAPVTVTPVSPAK
jgi:beta-lactamase regulating signal transducer with metallopeptidase domain